MEKLNWGILGCGTIAHEMAQSMLDMNHEIYAVSHHNSMEKALDFAMKYKIRNAYATVDDLLADENIDIVYIASPHNSHYDIMKKAILANKHILCEKAITVNDRQLEELVVLAKEHHVVIQEAMTIYHMPLYKKLKEIIDDGAIGKVKMIQVNFGSCKEYDVNNRFFSKELAGGALLDIGVYATSFARYFLSSKPNTVLTTVDYFETGVDEQSGIIMKNQDGQMVVMALTMRAKQPKRGVIAGEEGFVEVNVYPRASKATITYTIDGHQEIIETGDSQKALQYEVIDMETDVINHTGEDVLQLSRDVSSLLSAIRCQWGMTYPFE